MNEILVRRERRSRRVLFNLACSIAEHTVSGAMALFLTPFLVKKIGIELYGLYPIVLEIASVFGIIFGIVNSTSGRYIAIEKEQGNTENASKYFSAVFFSNAVLSAVVLVPMSLAVAFADKLFEIPAESLWEVRIFAVLVFASVIIDALASVFGSVYFVTNRLDIRSGQQLAVAGVKAALLATLLLVFDASLISVGIAILVSGLVGSAIQIIVSEKLIPTVAFSFFEFSLSHAKRVAASGLWYSVNRVSSVMMGGAMMIIANMFFLPSVSGVYSVAYVVVNALSGVVMMLASVFVPISAKHFARGEKNRFRDSLVRDEKIIGCFASVAISSCIGFCDDFFSLWLGEVPDRLLLSLTVTLLSPILSVACSAPIINVAMVMNRTKKLSLLFLTGGMLTLAAALGVTFFTNVGIWGVAAVSCLAQTLWYSVAVPIFAGRALDCSPKYFLIPVLKTYVGAGLSLVFCLAFGAMCDIKMWIELFIVVAAAMIGCATISFFVIFKKFKGFGKARIKIYKM